MKYKVVKFITEEQIEKRVKELGEIITKEYSGKSLKLIGVLKGCVPFFCKLMQNIDNPNLTIDFMAVSSYGSGTSSSGIVKILKDLDTNIEGENVIIAEDIIDSGHTFAKLIDLLSVRNPKSLKVCTLLDKPTRREVDIKPDYVGFAIEDKYVVGYGMDYNQYYRQLPYIGEVIFEDTKKS